MAASGIDDSMYALAKRLRKDINIQVRPFFLKHAIEQAGPGLTTLEDYYCLSAVTLPYGQIDIEAAEGEKERHWKQQICCQIDLGVSADGAQEAEEKSLDVTASRCLGVSCGLILADHYWKDEVQLEQRKRLGVDMPLCCWDGKDTKIFLILLPEDAIISSDQGMLVFMPPGVNAASALSNARTEKEAAERVKPSGEMTIADWSKAQDQFKHLPKLPKNWIRCKSRSGDTIYFWNLKTNKSQMDFPLPELPEGWTKEKSKSTGKTYYFHAKKRISQFNHPGE
jgi:hypothetical protein